MYLELLPEVQETVQKYLLLTDLKKLSLTCRECCNLLQPLIFKKVIMEHGDLVFTDNMVQNLQHTETIVMRGYFSSDIFKRGVLFNSLRTLLLFCDVTEEGLGEICDAVPQLKEIAVNDFNSLQSFAHLAKLKNLEEFSVDHRESSMIDVIQSVSGLDSLKVISIGYCQYMPDLAFHHMTSLHNLQELTIYEGVVEIVDKFMGLASLPELRKLDLSHCDIHNKRQLGLLIRCLESLEELILDGVRSLDHYDFLNICTLPKLKKLDLSHIAFFHRNSDLDYVESLTSLEELILFECPLTEDFLCTVAGLPNIRTLDVRNTSFSEDELQRIFHDKVTIKEMELKCGESNDYDCSFYMSISGCG